jgi:hypothetical protein
VLPEANQIDVLSTLSDLGAASSGATARAFADEAKGRARRKREE